MSRLQPFTLLGTLVAAGLLAISTAWAESPKPRVKIATSLGDIVVELAADKAPETVKNFLRYTDDKFYDGTIFHRVIKNFMIQGGGFDAKMTQKQTQAPIRNEARADLKNKRGTIAMARTGDPHSATAQFFINHADNGNLDFRNATPQGIGYAVFGRVVEGMDVVDKIANVPTGFKSRMQDVPLETVTITSVRRVP